MQGGGGDGWLARRQERGDKNTESGGGRPLLLLLLLLVWLIDQPAAITLCADSIWPARTNMHEVKDAAGRRVQQSERDDCGHCNQTAAVGSDFWLGGAFGWASWLRFSETDGADTRSGMAGCV